MKTIFEKIIERQIPATIEYEDDYVIVIHDIAPKAKVHLLIIPKKVIPSIAHLQHEEMIYLEHVMQATLKMAEKFGLNQSGYRLLTNHGKDAGQEILHLHFHLLGGNTLASLG